MARKHHVASLVKTSQRRSSQPFVGTLQRILSSRAFNAFITVLILLNVVEMGAAVELKSPEWQRNLRLLHYVCTAFFVSEIAAKMYTWGARQYFHENVNKLDTMIVILAVVDTWILPSAAQYEGGALNPLQMIRWLRLLRVMRLFEVNKRLLVVVKGLVASLSSIFWVGVLLTLVIYAFAIFCITTLKHDHAVQGYFEDLSTSMLTLFSMALLTEWGNIVWPVWKSQPWVVPLFVFFVMLTSLGIVNIIIGIIVEQTTEASRWFREHDHEMRMQERIQKVKVLSEVLYKLDLDSTVRLSRHEVLAAITNAEFDRLTRELNLPKGLTAHDLSVLIAGDSSSSLSKEQFIDGMYRLLNNNGTQSAIMTQLLMGKVQDTIHLVHQDLVGRMQVGFEQLQDQIRE